MRGLRLEVGFGGKDAKGIDSQIVLNNALIKAIYFQLFYHLNERVLIVPFLIGRIFTSILGTNYT